MSGFTQRLANQIASGDPVSVRRALDELVEFMDQSGGGGGSQFTLDPIPITHTDAFWLDGSALLLTSLVPGQVLLDLLLVVTTGFTTGVLAPTASLYYGDDVATASESLGSDPWAFGLDASLASTGLAIESGAPVGGMAKSVAVDGAINGVSRQMPAVCVTPSVVVMYADDAYALTDGAGLIYPFIYTPA